MFAGQRDAAVDLAQIVVVLLARLVGPVGEAALRERHAMPGDGDAVFELGRVLRMDLRAQFDRLAHALLAASSR